MSRGGVMNSVSSLLSYAACASMLLVVECDAAFSGSFFRSFNKRHDDQVMQNERKRHDEQVMQHERRHQEHVDAVQGFLHNMPIMVIVFVGFFGLFFIAMVILVVCQIKRGGPQITVTHRRESNGALLTRDPAVPVEGAPSAPSQVEAQSHQAFMDMAQHEQAVHQLHAAQHEHMMQHHHQPAVMQHHHLPAHPQF